jgi:predicted secreted hydrolase
MLVIALLLGLILLAVGIREDSPDEVAPAPPQWQISQLLGGSAAVDPGFRRADSLRQFDFPADHRAHPAYRSEWWYLTGNLVDTEGQPFAFQFTIFRQALRPIGAEPPDNAWLNPQIYLGHLALIDLNQQSHRSVERLSRAGPGLAGSAAAPLRIWLEDWQLVAATESALFPLQLLAADSDQQIGLNLAISATKSRVLQGDAGLSQKSPEPGNASYYYSYPRLKVSGQILWDGKPHSVNGLAWYDHEWSSSVLADYQTGWDWFSLQLDDGRELMLFQIRAKPGQPLTQQSILIDPAGNTRQLANHQVDLTVLKHWDSPSGKRYPARWRLRIPTQNLDLEIVPRLADQEMRHSITYWEGAVAISGSHSGLGFVELVGY